jgi:hypothetical protein
MSMVVTLPKNVLLDYIFVSLLGQTDWESPLNVGQRALGLATIPCSGLLAN